MAWMGIKCLNPKLEDICDWLEDNAAEHVESEWIVPTLCGFITNTWFEMEHIYEVSYVVSNFVGFSAHRHGELHGNLAAFSIWSGFNLASLLGWEQAIRQLANRGGGRIPKLVIAKSLRGLAGS